MSRPGNCYDHAFSESFWRSLKYELVYHHRFTTRAEARAAVFDYIETYNAPDFTPASTTPARSTLNPNQLN